MTYQCPIERKERYNTAEDLATHMAGITRLFDEHISWMESKGISYMELTGVKGAILQKESYKLLIDVIEREDNL